MTTRIADLLRLDDVPALVTGGARGIGRAVCERLAEAGAAVMVADIDGDGAAEAAAAIRGAGGRAGACRLDVADEGEVAAAVDACVQTFGGLRILVNNAGIFPSVPMLEMTAADFDRVIAVNLRGVYLCTRHAARAMVAAGGGGSIVTVTSIDALHPSMTGLAHYDASKHGAWGFTKNVALELAPHGIRVNAIAPGAVATPGVAEMQQGGDGGSLDAFLAAIPLRRMGEPDDIATVALFLVSPMAGYMTGSQVVVDGGVLVT